MPVTDPVFAPELVSLVRPMDEAQHHPNNIRVHNVQAIANSLARFGQQTPIVVQKSTRYICKGNGTYKAAGLLGWTDIAMSIEDFDDSTALQYLFADNKASDLATYDRERVVEGLRKLEAGPGIMDTLWTVDELEDLEFGLKGADTLPIEDFTGDYAMDRSDVAADRGVSAGVKMREIPVLLTVADHAEFIANLRILQEAYKMTGTVALIVEAVKRQAALVTHVD